MGVGKGVSGCPMHVCMHKHMHAHMHTCVTFSVHISVFELGVHRDPWPWLTNSLKCINSSSSHTSLIVTIEGLPATKVGPTNS